jgi:ribosomal protein S18 acetylase RimI-like enzyme
MEIRKMLIEDYYVVYRLWANCPGVGLSSVDDSREGYERYLRRNPDTCFLAEEDGQVIGTILACDDGRRGHINHLAVAEDHRRRGVARKLTEAALDALRRQGVSKVNLVAFGTNVGGNAFWEKMGFRTRPDLVYRDIVLLEPGEK